jgi:hypothetical protein
VHGLLEACDDEIGQLVVAFRREVDVEGQLNFAGSRMLIG